MHDFCEDRRRPLVLLVGILLLAGCAQAPLVTGPDVQTALVFVRWSNQEQIDAACPAEQKSINQTIEHTIGCYANGMIYMPRPSSWSDSFLMEVLGHEVLHALGYRHE